MGEDSYAKLSIESRGEQKLTLIVNLQNYYVFGFLIDDKCYSFRGVDEKLRNAGFEVEEVLPYGDAYYQIGESGVEESVCGQLVSAEDIRTSIDFIIDMSKSWESKRQHLLRVFWALVEGIRFSGISDIVYNLFNGESEKVTYRYFFYMAERWEKLSVGNAYLGRPDKSIAVYDIRPLE
ncbi:MAG: hypothetical protein F6J86_23165 [Symploca sp. SIO1B1]|nr:hypothetical protein [Symploca sp. SIO1B1]